MLINKWTFAHYNDGVTYQNFQKTIPFMVFTDILSNPETIREALSLIKFPVETLVCLGEKSIGFGVQIKRTQFSASHYDDLVNSVGVCFSFSHLAKDVDYLLSPVLGAAIPICNKYNPELKRLGLLQFSCSDDPLEMAKLLTDILKHPIYYNLTIRKLAQKYDRQRIKSKTV